MRAHVLRLAAACAGLTLPAAADEVRLADGTLLVGAVERRGDTITVETLDGTVEIAAGRVVRIRSDAELLDELTRLENASDSGAPFARLELARVAQRFGLHDEMWRHLARCFELMDQRPSPRALDFLGGLERELLPARFRKADAETRVLQLLRLIRPGTAEIRQLAIREVLPRIEGGEEALRLRARRASSSAQRLAALHALRRRGTEVDDRFIWRTTVVDNSAEVRRAAANMVSDAGQAGQAIRYLSPGLAHRSPGMRIRTAEAYADMADPAAIDYLVAAGPATAGSVTTGAARGNIAMLDQEAYVRDFDVEVAQAAFIADPKVDVLQSGLVLDISVIGTRTVRTQVVSAYRQALRSIAGSDPGARTSRWAEWRAALADAAGPTSAGR